LAAGRRSREAAYRGLKILRRVGPREVDKEDGRPSADLAGSGKAGFTSSILVGATTRIKTQASILLLPEGYDGRRSHILPYSAIVARFGWK